MLAANTQRVLDFIDGKPTEWPRCIPDEPIPLDHPLVLEVMSRVKVNPKISSKINIVKGIGSIEHENTIQFDHTDDEQDRSDACTLFDKYDKKCESFSDFVERIHYLYGLYEYDSIDDFIDEFNHNTNNYYNIPGSIRKQLAERFKYSFDAKHMKMQILEENGIPYRIVSSSTPDPDYENDPEDIIPRGTYERIAEYHDYIAKNPFMNMYDADLYTNEYGNAYYTAQHNNVSLCKHRQRLITLYHSIIAYIDSFE